VTKAHEVKTKNHAVAAQLINGVLITNIRV
ncbi:MAG: Unknown protein, partial [uncultured Aureispira sp.]